MSDADWLAAVAAAPDDPVVRLAYADWLDDHGDPRAELLRLDVTLARRRANDPAARTSGPDAEPFHERLAELVAGADAWWRMRGCRMPVEYRTEVWAAEGDSDSLLPWRVAGVCQCSGPAAVAVNGFVAPPGEAHRFVRALRDSSRAWLMCRAAVACERRTIRYGGRDPVVIGLLGNRPEFCDYLVRESPPGIHRATEPVISIVQPPNLLSPTTMSSEVATARPDSPLGEMYRAATDPLHHPADQAPWWTVAYFAASAVALCGLVWLASKLG